jgi:hypothetical protein
VENMSSEKMVEIGLNLGQRVSVGSEGQVRELTNMLACIKWPMDHFRYEVAGKGQVMGVPR